MSTVAVSPVVSSLRVRGADFDRRSIRPNNRVIPACAGSSSVAASAPGGDPCHPCVCGEQTRLSATITTTVVSSLRVRGAGAGRQCRPLC